MVEAEGELVGVGDDFGSGGIGVRAKGAGRVVGKRIAREQAAMPGSTGTDERVDGRRETSRGVEPGALLGGGHGHDLRGAENLAKALILREVEGAIAAIVEMGNETGPPLVNPNSLRRKGGMRPG